ncbi:hypothetical protein CALVIDRAFT_62184 [Calocera viscosa TUFC12733]|uniref:Uncharacterized protein n=1 Tax=Calocera viscosa (strain TUFC12733) TaxID=1330018 RepID=A0A167NMC9_CALVF|nr:hypothetical protein CALVIDRAFT_62184 [Calocera viscosa TUFC12733]
MKEVTAFTAHCPLSLCVIFFHPSSARAVLISHCPRAAALSREKRSATTAHLVMTRESRMHSSLPCPKTAPRGHFTRPAQSAVELSPALPNYILSQPLSHATTQNIPRRTNHTSLPVEAEFSAKPPRGRTPSPFRPVHPAVPRVEGRLPPISPLPSRPSFFTQSQSQNPPSRKGSLSAPTKPLNVIHCLNHCLHPDTSLHTPSIQLNE